MKAREENGVITIYPEIPQDWKHYLNFRQAPESVWQQEGFFNVEEPVRDPITQDLGELFFDGNKEFFTYAIITKLLPPLDEAKALKIAELKRAVKDLYSTIQWLVETYRMEETPLPTTIRDKIRLIRTKYELAKTQINSLTTLIEVLQWKVPYEIIHKMKIELEQLG